MVNKIINTKPIKMWIDGKVFLIQQLENLWKRRKIEPQNTEEPQHSENNLLLLDIHEEEGNFKTTIKVPKLYYDKIQTLPNFNIEHLSEIMQTHITLPKNPEDGIVLYSKCTQKLHQAVKHIHSAIGTIRERNATLQITCIPCQNLVIKERFENLKKELLSMEQDIEGLHESIFMNPLKLHVTIDVFALLNEFEKEQAVMALQEYKDHLSELVTMMGPLRLDISTLDCMNSNVKKVDVLYANVKLLNESQEYNLQRIVNEISAHFYHKGLVKNWKENVKVHMTVINTKYRKERKLPRRRRRQSFNATKILEKFKDYSFGQCDFDSLHLSDIMLKGKDGFYKPLAVVKLNENKNTKT
ncbi:activating signal cointegrator 1 complex subunit 1-like [Euwallacea fornicatus]|uniref:activating signal cointegrator 1 complex subunit 1-like n=1 Tax=Euwallacea fornicatus TaxID=995702 RepID=UPI00338D8E7E